MNRRILYIMILAVGAFVLSACQSKEEKVIDMYQSLIERIETQGADWDTEDWQEAINEMEEIEKYSENCNFSSQQRREVLKLQGKLAGVVLKQAPKVLNSEIEAYMEALNSFMEGFDESSIGIFDVLDMDVDIDNEIVNEIEINEPQTVPDVPDVEYNIPEPKTEKQEAEPIKAAPHTRLEKH